MDKRIRAAIGLFVIFLLGGCAIAPPLPHAPEPAWAVPVVATRVATPTPAPTPEPEPSPEPELALPETYQAPEGAFVPDDLSMMGITYRSSARDVRAELGEPLFREEEPDETTGLLYVTLAYDGLFIGTLGDTVLTGMTITSEDWPGPRDLRVGATLEEVMAAFLLSMPEETDGDAEGADVLYSDKSDTGVELPPLAELSRDANENGAYVLRLIAPLEPYPDDVRANGRYHSYQHAGVTFYFDESTDELVRIHWFVGTLQ